MKTFLKILAGREISDILTVGILDLEGGIAEYSPFLSYLYIEFDSDYLMLESIEQNSKLKITLEEGVKYPFEIDEDFYHCRSSILEIVLKDSMADNRIQQIQIFNPEESTNGIICEALSIKLNCDYEVFFDPTFYFGINIGGVAQRHSWLENPINSARRPPNVEEFVFPLPPKEEA